MESDCGKGAVSLCLLGPWARKRASGEQTGGAVGDDLGVTGQLSTLLQSTSEVLVSSISRSL
jgi:hypothetical protein